MDIRRYEHEKFVQKTSHVNLKDKTTDGNACRPNISQKRDKNEREVNFLFEIEQCGSMRLGIKCIQVKVKVEGSSQCLLFFCVF